MLYVRGWTLAVFVPLLPSLNFNRFPTATFVARPILLTDTSRIWARPPRPALFKN